MKKITLIIGVLALMFVPASIASAAYNSDDDGTTVDNQSVNEDSNVTLDVLAAIELAQPADDSDKVAPVAGGATDANIGFSTSADLRSNLSWAVATTLSDDKLQKGEVGLLSNFDTSAQGTENRSGSRNSSNSAQTYSANYDQDVSWGDEAGRYTVTATHTASQTLGQ